MKFNKNGGFTLVELIVVIAILAILAGVAVPAYSGYIAKAEEAADLQLMSAVTQAFGAALAENDCSMEQLESANLKVDGAMSTWTVTKADLKSATNAITNTTPATPAPQKTLDNAKLTAAMQRYLAGNEGATFKVYGTLSFANGEWKGSETKTVPYGGGYISLSPEGLAALQGSSFMVDGIGALMDKVDQTTQIAADMGDSSLMSALTSSAGFQSAAAAALGVPTSELQKELLALATDMQKENPEMSLDQCVAQVQAHAAVLYAAQTSSSTLTPSAAISQLQQGTFAESVRTQLATGGDMATGMSGATLAYGMYTAYCAQSETATMPENPGDVLDHLSDPEFQAYLAGDQASADATAYLSALSMITSSTGDSTAVRQLMLEGFGADSSLAELLEQQLGK